MVRSLSSIRIAAVLFAVLPSAMARAGNTGACCRGANCYSNVTLDDCDAVGGEFFPGQTCAQACGTPPTGACCLGPPAFACTPNQTLAQCNAAGGTWLGANSSCAICSPPQTGACCRGPACFENVMQEQCDQVGGEFIAGATCAQACAPPTGACCFGPPAFNCTTGVTQGNCASAGGEWLGAGSNCSTCTQPQLFACCFSGGGCQPATVVTCAQMGGIFFAGQTCDNNPCSAGACCRGTTCVSTSAFDCIVDGFEFVGAGTSCQTNPCAPASPCANCPGDANHDMIVDGLDISPFTACHVAASMGGNPPDCQCADVDNNGQFNEADVAMFVQLLVTASGQPCQ